MRNVNFKYNKPTFINIDYKMIYAIKIGLRIN